MYFPQFLMTCMCILRYLGNPTGQQLALKDVQALIRFCIKHKLVLLADEVYQENVYTPQPFVSARKVLSDMGPPYDKVD